MNNSHFHPNFRLNEQSFKTIEELLDYSKIISSSVFSFLSDWFNRENFVTVQTSGSTGKPKHIRLKKKHMVNSALATGTYFNLSENTTALVCLSTDYIAGKMMLVRALVLGWHIDLVEPSSHPLNGISKQYDFCAMVPMQVENSLNGLNLIEKIIVGGGVISKELQNKIEQLNTEVFATYGMTETITHIAVKKLNHIYHAELDSASNYVVLPNIRISKDIRNCLIIDAPKVSDNKIVTNDIVELISDSKFKWLGRYDNIINSGGIKLVPEQIEAQLSLVIDQRFFVIGVADKLLGEKMILIIEKTSEILNLKPQISNLKSLSKFDIPKEIYFIEKFVETETKKINRQATLAKLLL